MQRATTITVDTSGRLLSFPASLNFRSHPSRVCLSGWSVVMLPSPFLYCPLLLEWRSCCARHCNMSVGAVTTNRWASEREQERLLVGQTKWEGADERLFTVLFPAGRSIKTLIKSCSCLSWLDCCAAGLPFTGTDRLLAWENVIGSDAK